MSTQPKKPCVLRQGPVTDRVHDFCAVAVKDGAILPYNDFDVVTCSEKCAKLNLNSHPVASEKDDKITLNEPEETSLAHPLHSSAILPTFPNEIIDELIENIDDDYTAYKIAVALRRTHVRDVLLSRIAKSMDRASEEGIVDLLEWWKQSGLLCNYSTEAMDDASAEGHVDVLDWWEQSGLECKYTIDAMDWASLYGHVKVLDWWKESALECKYSNKAMDRASEDGHVNVLDWWKQSGLECEYSEMGMYNASWNGHVNVLDWWKQSGLECKYSNDAMHVGLLDWWKQSGLISRSKQLKMAFYQCFCCS